MSRYSKKYRVLTIEVSREQLSVFNTEALNTNNPSVYYGETKPTPFLMNFFNIPQAVFSRCNRFIVVPL